MSGTNPEENSLSDSSFVSGMKRLFTMNKKEAAVIAVVAVGVLISLYHWSGAVVVGVVAGLFYAEEVKNWAQHGKALVEGKDQFQTLLLAGISLCVLFATPSLFFGVLAGVGVSSIIRK
ncbi:MAG: hypothetical protein ACI9S8_000775 [Chlamydiales bacterium]|jgi:hypothetical protein